MLDFVKSHRDFFLWYLYKKILSINDKEVTRTFFFSLKKPQTKFENFLYRQNTSKIFIL